MRIVDFVESRTSQAQFDSQFTERKLGAIMTDAQATNVQLTLQATPVQSFFHGPMFRELGPARGTALLISFRLTLTSLQQSSTLEVAKALGSSLHKAFPGSQNLHRGHQIYPSQERALNGHQRVLMV